MNGLVPGLDAVSAGMLARVGGKAANLGELLLAGLPVPDGFCLTTDAYLQAVAPLGLHGVHRALQATPSNDVAALAGLAGHARASYLGGTAARHRGGSALSVSGAGRRRHAVCSGGRTVLGHRGGPAAGQLCRAAGTRT